MSNDCHKSSKGNLANFHEKMKENVNKSLEPSNLKIFFEEKENNPQKQAKIIREKRKELKISAKRLTYFRNVIK
ncbi:hypothetical protein [Streptococcus oralis]|uniref:hypothetical protein n=1 Tax=Streptococcus oralis TaxID=1303 RepID=UPI001302088E|nr:hypothetical protein [Streptococcus oralis]